MGDLNSDLELLKTWRDSNARKSREIVSIWETTVGNAINKLGKEKHLVLEQVCIAALDTYELEIVKTCIKQLAVDFPTSLRVKKLEAMYYECIENYDKALEVLNSIIEQDKTFSGAKKRRIAILKAQGHRTDAIKELTEYLDVHMMDIEAWQELSDLYIAENDFNKAAFCVEELILCSPHNHLLHQRYADIKYTQGGLENLELARSYYCQALKLNSKNLRALYGLYLATSAIATSQKCTAIKKKEALKATEWSLKEINRKYENVQIDDIQKCLLALEI